MSSCLNSSNGSCLNGGQCVSDKCVCSSECFLGSRCETYFNTIDLPLSSVILEDDPSNRVIHIAVITIFVIIGLANNAVALMTFTRERIRITACGIYLIVFSTCDSVLMICLQTSVLAIIEYKSDSYRSWSCYGIPYVSSTMAYTGIWAGVGVSVERVLIECFNCNIFGSRLRAWLTSLGFFIFAAVSNLPAIFTLQYTVDPSGQLICTYDYVSHPAWNRFDTVFSYIYMIIPCVAHLACAICILTTIARRKILIYQTSRPNQRLFRVWLRQLYIHRDFLIPPVFLITCLLPSVIEAHLLVKCVPYSALGHIHLHMAFILLLVLPSTLIYLVYIYPSEVYMREFEQTWIYRIPCCCLYRKRKNELRRRSQLPLAKFTARQLIENSHL